MSTLALGDAHIDLETGNVEGLGQSLTLTPRERELLRRLAHSPGAIVARETLAGAGPTRAADMAISRLRRRLGPAGRRIVTVRGLGYRLEVDPVGAVDLGWGRLDLPGRAVLVAGRSVRLSAQQAQLLGVLADSPGRPVSRHRLARALWGRGAELARLDVAVHRLRQRIELDPTRPRFVVSVPDQGLVLLDARIAHASVSHPVARQLVGRESLIDAVLARLARPGARLELHGPPGIGKSALAASLGARWAEGVEQTTCAVDLHGADSLREAQARLAAALGMEDIADDDALARSLAVRGVLLLVLDGDPPDPLAARLAAMVEEAPRLRLLVAGRRRRAGFDPVEVDGLGDAHARELLERSAGRPVSAEAGVVRRLQGNPLALELVGRRLGRGARDLARDLDLPLAPLRRAWRATVSGLSDEERRLAGLASWFHRPFHLADLADLADRPPPDAAPVVARLVADSVLRETPGGALSLPHAARALLSRDHRGPARRRYHDRGRTILAELLAAVPSRGGAALDAIEARWPDIRRGLDAAPLPERAPLVARLARQTAERIPRPRADSFAADLLEASTAPDVAPADRARSLRAIHALRWSRQSRSERIDMLRRALELATDAPLLAGSVVAELASVVAFSWGLDEARRLLAEHPLPSDAPPEETARRLRHAGRLELFAGQPTRGVARLREAVAIAEVEGLPLLEARCRMALGQALSAGTLGQEAEHHLRRAIGLTATHQVPEQHVRATLRLAQHLLRLGLRPNARELLDVALAAAVRAGLLRLEEQCASTLGFLRIGTEELDVALAHLDRAIVLSRRHGGQRALYVALSNRGLALALDGRPAEARRDLETALAGAGGRGWYRVLGLAYRAVAELLDGDGAQAVRTTTEADELLDTFEHPSSRGLRRALEMLRRLVDGTASAEELRTFVARWEGEAEIEGVVAGLRRAVT